MTNPDPPVAEDHLLTGPPPNPNPPVAEDSLRWAVEEIGNRVAQMQIFDTKVEQMLRVMQYNTHLLEQIKQALDRLQPGLPEAPPPPPEAVPEPEPEPDPDSPLATRVDELELSVRSARCLRNNRIHTVRQLVEKTPAELLRMDNFGRVSLREVEAVLRRQLGLQLKLSATA